MKRVLVLLMSLGVLAAGCRKKTPTTYCWELTVTDSTYSQIDSLHVPAIQHGVEICDFTSDMINTYINSHSFKDTTNKTPGQITVMVQMESAEVY